MAQYRQPAAPRSATTPTRPRRTLRSALAVVAVAVVIGAVSMAAALLVGGNARASRTAHTTSVRLADSADPGDSAASSRQYPAEGEPTVSPSTPTAASTTAPKLSPPPAQPPGIAGLETQVITLVNQERTKAGCKPVTADSRLTAAARAHSADMARRDFFDHTNPDGVPFADRITAAGYTWSSAGENIAKGQKDPASVMKSWMNSPGHRANILNCGYKNLGVGLAYDPKKSPIWTQDFAAPA